MLVIFYSLTQTEWREGTKQERLCDTNQKVKGSRAQRGRRVPVSVAEKKRGLIEDDEATEAESQLGERQEVGPTGWWLWGLQWEFRTQKEEMRKGKNEE